MLIFSQQQNSEYSLLQLEQEIYSKLLLLQTANFPKIHQYYQDSDYSILEMELLGQSLEDMVQLGPIPLKLFNIMVLQMVESLEQIHGIGFVHRDVKPDNFLVSAGDARKVFLIDFGLIKGWRVKEGEHMEFREGKKLCGTPRLIYIRGFWQYS
jgi:serine/threonine protein kinase